MPLEFTVVGSIAAVKPLPPWIYSFVKASKLMATAPRRRYPIDRKVCDRSAWDQILIVVLLHDDIVLADRLALEVDFYPIGKLPLASSSQMPLLIGCCEPSVSVPAM